MPHRVATKIGAPAERCHSVEEGCRAIRARSRSRRKQHEGFPEAASSSVQFESNPIGPLLSGHRGGGSSREEPLDSSPPAGPSQASQEHPQVPPASNPGGASMASIDARPVRGSRGNFSEEVCAPGQIHSSHVVYETQRYVFCAVCGTYGQYIKRARLHTVCPRQPRTRWAKLAIDDLRQGIEPAGRRTHTPAVPYFAD